MTNQTKDFLETRPTPTVEDYLAIIYVMERDQEDIAAVRLAESLEVSPPTVAITLKRMERDGWIASKGQKGIVLTDAGRAAARSVIRRHMLTEWLLARMLHVPWSKIHDAAHHIEHTISDEIETQMRLNLDDPKFCPHGNPLPGNEAETAEWVPLTEVPLGQRVTIRRIHETAEDDAAFLQFLEVNGVVPEARGVVREVLPFNQTITLEVDGKPVVLGYAAARYIRVAVEP